MTLEEQVVALASRAGATVLEVYASVADGTQKIEWKSDDSPLTLADRRAHELIAEGLRQLTPDIPVLSEEGSMNVASTGLRWIVDPLDGTKEFIKRTGDFTVNIALVRDTTPEFGVVHAPVLATTYLGKVGGGATRRDSRGSASISCTKSPRHDALRVVASKDHAGPQVRALLDALPGAQTLSMGSSLKFCLIAEGRADLYLRDGPTMEWDTAAAHAVLQAAGGEVFTLDGQPLRYGKPEHRNPHFIAVGDPSLNWRELVG